jgi:methionine-rich copper-binding protein CopC
MTPTIRPTRRGLALVFMIAACGVGIASSEVAAHSRLVKSEPSARAVLDTLPKELKLWFNEGVEPAFAKVWIIPAQGPQVPLSTRGDSSDPHLLIATLPDTLPAGPVVIGYHMLSVDGHVVEDKLTFTIKAPS